MDEIRRTLLEMLQKLRSDFERIEQILMLFKPLSKNDWSDLVHDVQALPDKKQLRRFLALNQLSNKTGGLVLVQDLGRLFTETDLTVETGKQLESNNRNYIRRVKTFTCITDDLYCRTDKLREALED